ncbi:hypothetical protein D9758_003029 [Tetrapyrgos nigripes]|uniref:N-acetyltransferase domain-containing protein n=1 Tax=Tetrapyrgos nigripes TaxID=182062 RepID=A0A8H5LTQ7_9AGAR|nr:hypothetical protein D9758_003029 [Tetrapyrgos nigripes]
MSDTTGIDVLSDAAPFPPSPIIALKNVVVRPYQSEDLETMCHHANNKKIAQYMMNTFPSPYTLEAGRYWLGMKLEEQTNPSKKPKDFVIAVDEGNTCIGGIGLKPGSDVQERYMEVGYWISEEFWGRGITTEVLKAFLSFVWREYPNVERLGGTVYSGNEASVRVLKKAGFVHEGTMRKHVWKNGEFKDLLVFGLLREECV